MNKAPMLRMLTPAENQAVMDRIFKRRATLDEFEAMRPQLQEEGIAALKRLLAITYSDTGQAGVIARFLLNLYNGERFPFDMTDFRRLDHELFADCIAVLKMDCQPLQEVHKYFENGGAIWEKMATDWNARDFHGENWRTATD